MGSSGHCRRFHFGFCSSFKTPNCSHFWLTFTVCGETILELEFAHRLKTHIFWHIDRPVSLNPGGKSYTPTAFIIIPLYNAPDLMLQCITCHLCVRAGFIMELFRRVKPQHKLGDNPSFSSC